MKTTWCLEHKNLETGNFRQLFIGEVYCKGKLELSQFCGIDRAKCFEDKKSAFIFLVGLNQLLVEKNKPTIDDVEPTEHEWVEDEV